MSKELKISLLGYEQGTLRTFAYEAVSRYYPQIPIKPVLYQAFTLPGDSEEATTVGWQYVSDLDAVIKDSEAEYIDVCLPPGMHFAAVMEAIKAGKHVFCESPLTTSVDEARQMVAAAEASPKLLNSVNFFHRRCPANVYARKLISENKLGKLIEARLQLTCNVRRYDWFPGMLHNSKFHLFDLLYYITNMRPIELGLFPTTRADQCKDGKTARDARRRIQWYDVEHDNTPCVTYTLPGGAIGSFKCTNNDGAKEDVYGYKLKFENGAIRWSNDDSNYLNVYDASKPERGWGRVLANGNDFAYFSLPDGQMYNYRDFMVNACYENMLKIAGAEEVAPIASFRDAYDVLRILKAVRTSWKERTWVKLADFQ